MTMLMDCKIVRKSRIGGASGVEANAKTARNQRTESKAICSDLCNAFRLTSPTCIKAQYIGLCHYVLCTRYDLRKEFGNVFEVEISRNYVVLRHVKTCL